MHSSEAASIKNVQKLTTTCSHNIFTPIHKKAHHIQQQQQQQQQKEQQQAATAES